MFLRQLILLVCLFVPFCEVQSVSLERALKGDDVLRITTITRSVSNNLMINTERKILRSAIEYLIVQKEPDFSEVTEILKGDIEEYLQIPERIKILKKSRELDLFVIKMQNILKDDVSVTDDVLKEFITKACEKDWAIEKNDPLLSEIFSEKSAAVWECLSEFDKSILEVDISKFLQVTDSDVLKYVGNYKDEAMYQAMSGIISMIKKDFPSLYIESEKKEDLFKMLQSYYLEHFNALMLRIKEARKFYKPAITLLVTNEYFWGKVPMEVKEAYALMSKWSSLPNVLFCSNFLLVDELKDPATPKKLASALNKLHSEAHKTKKIFLMESEHFVPEYDAHYEITVPSFQKYIDYLNKVEPSTIKGIFKNESMIFWNQHLLTTYDKATYVDEQENILSKGFIYEFGLGFDNIGEKISESDVVHNLVSTQICRDLLAQIRVNDLGTQRYHILQSNTINFDGEVIPKNAVYVIHVNFDSPSVVYKRAVHFSSISVDKCHMWDQVGPFDWHLNFRLGLSNYSIQTLSIRK